MRRFVAFVLLLSLVASIRALPAKRVFSRQPIVRNAQTKHLGSLSKAARELENLQKVSKINKDGVVSNGNLNKEYPGNMDVGNNQMYINDILDRIKQDFSNINLSRRIADIPEPDQTAIFSTMFHALIEKYSSYCPAAALAKLIAGYLRYSVYDLYEDEELNGILTNIDGAQSQHGLSWKSIQTRQRVYKPDTRYLTNSERVDLAQDLVRIRQMLLDNLIDILQQLDFPSADMVFWQIEYDVYLSTTQGDTMAACIENLVDSAFKSGYLDETDICSADRRDVWNELSEKLEAIIQTLEQKSALELYGISPGKMTKDSAREATISRFVNKLERFRRDFISILGSLADLLSSGNTADIEGFLAYQLTFYTERWIRLHTPTTEEPITDGNEHLTLAEIHNDPRLNKFLLKSTKEMLFKLFARFTEQAQAEGINTERFVDILSNALDYLESDF